MFCPNCGSEMDETYKYCPSCGFENQPQEVDIFNEPKISMVDIDRLGGLEFERFCADLLRRTGFTEVCVTKKSGDNGVDIIAKREGLWYAFQCKRYSNKVGNKAIQEVYSGKDIYRCQNAVVITNSFFTEQAQKSAEKLNVRLINRFELELMIKKAYAPKYAPNKETKPQITVPQPKVEQTNQLEEQRTGCMKIFLYILAIEIIIMLVYMIWRYFNG